MSIPKHYEIRVPVLKLLYENGSMKLGDFIDPLSKYFNLTEDEVNEIYP